MLDVLELGGLQKVTARLIEGLDIKQTPSSFEVSPQARQTGFELLP
jgi:hypothetical protein